MFLITNEISPEFIPEEEEIVSMDVSDKMTPETKIAKWLEHVQEVAQRIHREPILDNLPNLGSYTHSTQVEAE